MHRTHILVYLLSGILYTLADCEQNWDYAENGPAEWPSVCATCSGLKQSPIALWPSKVTYESSLGHVQFHGYHQTGAGFTVTDNGHTAFIQLPTDHLSTIRIPSNPAVTYKLDQIHFHWGFKSDQGSEHTIENNHFPIEMHMVHKANDGSIAVLAAFGQLSCEKEAKVLAELARTLTHARETGTTASVPGEFSVSGFLPHDKDRFFSYSGSLTTPPCSETVEWIIFAHPIHIKPHTLRALRGLRNPEHQHILINYRQTQGLNGRVVKFRGNSFPQLNFTEIESCDHKKRQEIVVSQ